MSGVFNEGEEYWVYGTPRRDLAGVSMAHPEIEHITEDSASGVGIVPVYPLTAGISQKYIRGLVRSALPLMTAEEFLPEEIIAERRLAPLSYALSNIHFPEDEHALNAARLRLIFEEMFLFQTQVFFARGQSDIGARTCIDRLSIEDASGLFHFELTGAQKRAIREIRDDMAGGNPMRRLLQGDVGSGKTAVAAASAYFAAKSGFQTAIMAPTEILATQHYEEFCKLFKGTGIRVSLLASGLSPAQKRESKTGLQSGETLIAIGTHALLEPDVVFKNLGLVITDEQHRFGVKQRLRLREKGEAPDTLVMTATPIPRTQALILYADLDVSILDEVPPGRIPVTTRYINSEKRDDAYGFAERVMEKGGQVYVVAPSIGDEAVLPLASALELTEELSARFPRRRVAMLHGRMKGEDKDETMRSFAAGEINMLVSTVVIEVGVNVPNATMMIIENAERFGLAGLHQLRGRVGRGAEKSYCVLISDADNELAVKRCETIARETDGFKIADLDLELRGPGDLFGVRQHGMAEFRLADPSKHMDILKMANSDARKLIERDPVLSLPEHMPLLRMIEGSYVSQ